MEMLIVSADVYHQEFVPIQARKCARFRYWREVLGPGRVRGAVAVGLCPMSRSICTATTKPRSREAFAAALGATRIASPAAPPTAWRGFFERHSPEHFRDEKCVREVLDSKHVHIDPYGNVFPGVCSGIILGNANQTPIPQLGKNLAETLARSPGCRSGGRRRGLPAIRARPRAWLRPAGRRLRRQMPPLPARAAVPARARRVGAAGRAARGLRQRASSSARRSAQLCPADPRVGRSAQQASMHVPPTVAGRGA